MIHTVRCAFVALPLVLLFAGCSGNDRAEFRPDSATGLSARTTGQGAARDIDHRGSLSGGARPAPRPDGLLGYVAPSNPRYDITLNQMRENVRNQTAVIIDARGSADFANGHVRGAVNMPAGRKEAHVGQLSQSVAPDQLIIIYCSGPHCDSGDMVYESLVPQGFTNMRVFKPGWEAIDSVSDLR
jgi:rhodanese-related sulfurtransferase